MTNFDLLMGLTDLEDELILDARKPVAQPHFRKRKLMALLTAAVIASTLAMTALASADTTHKLREFFVRRSDAALSDGQQEFVEENAVALQDSQTHDGYTLTLDTAISDGICTYFLFQLTAPEGTILDARSYDFREWYPLKSTLGTEFPGSGGWDTIDDDPGDNTVSLRLMFFHGWDEDNYDSIFSHTWNLRLEGLEATYLHNWDTPKMSIEEIFLSDGTWNFSITFPEQGNAEMEFITDPAACPCKTNIGIQGWHCEDVSITSLKVRAFSAVLTFQHPTAGMINADIEDIYAVMQDGSMAKLNTATGAPGHLTYHFDAPIVLADIDHILLPNGTRLYPPQE